MIVMMMVMMMSALLLIAVPMEVRILLLREGLERGTGTDHNHV